MTSQEMTSTGTIPELHLGWRMQMALASAGMSAQQMAEELGFTRQSLSRWMGGRGTPPKRLVLLQWAMRTGVDADWLIEGRYPAGSNPTGPAISCPQPGSNRRPAD